MSTQQQMHGAGGYVGIIERQPAPRGMPARYRYTIRAANGHWAGGGTGLRSLEEARESCRDDLSALWLIGDQQ